MISPPRPACLVPFCRPRSGPPRRAAGPASAGLTSSRDRIRDRRTISRPRSRSRASSSIPGSADAPSTSAPPAGSTPPALGRSEALRRSPGLHGPRRRRGDQRQRRRPPYRRLGNANGRRHLPSPGPPRRLRLRRGRGPEDRLRDDLSHGQGDRRPGPEGGRPDLARGPASGPRPAPAGGPLRLGKRRLLRAPARTPPASTSRPCGPWPRPSFRRTSPAGTSAAHWTSPSPSAAPRPRATIGGSRERSPWPPPIQRPLVHRRRRGARPRPQVRGRRLGLEGVWPSRAASTSAAASRCGSRSISHGPSIRSSSRPRAATSPARASSTD